MEIAEMVSKGEVEIQGSINKLFYQKINTLYKQTLSKLHEIYGGNRSDYTCGGDGVFFNDTLIGEFKLDFIQSEDFHTNSITITCTFVEINSGSIQG